MTYVITNSCCKDASCVEVCPVNAIHPRPESDNYWSADMLYINPMQCIDCGACAKACPVDVIYFEDDLPIHLKEYRQINASHFEDEKKLEAVPALTESHDYCHLKNKYEELRVAIVGSGAAGIYAARELLSKRGLKLDVYMFDRLPVPGGLIRSGVAPDHQDTKKVALEFDRLCSHNNFHFYGGVEIGKQLTHKELKEHFHGIIYASGAFSDKQLSITGENLPGCHGASEFVGWYNGHPDYANFNFDLSNKKAIIIGNGNVALDIARILVTDTKLLEKTDIAAHALKALRESEIREVIIAARRGPAHAAFTNPELLSLGQIEGANVTVEEECIHLIREMSPRDFAEKWRANILNEYAANVCQSSKRIKFLFMSSPIEILGDEKAIGVRFSRNIYSSNHQDTITVDHTKEDRVLEANLIISAVGFKGSKIPKLPFEEQSGVIANKKGRVLEEDQNTHMTGVYTTGWAKRGAKGTIGTNRLCAIETVGALLHDVEALRMFQPMYKIEQLHITLNQRHCNYIDTQGWKTIDQYERQTGNSTKRIRTKIIDVHEMRRVAIMN